MRPLAVHLGQLLTNYQMENRLPVEVIVPVPLHARRVKKRGYNQAALLAKEMSEGLGLPLARDSLVRVRSTVPQVGLSARRRRDNVSGAFQCPQAHLKGQRVLLVDDVCTTGATLEACSIALQQTDVASVWGLVLA